MKLIALVLLFICRTAIGTEPDIRVGAAAVNLKADNDMPLAGGIEARYTTEQEGELRAVATVIDKPGAGKVAIVACDVLWVTKKIVDDALAEIEKTTGIAPSRVLVNATHTHSAPGVAPAHAFGWSEKFADEVQLGIVKAVQEANAQLPGGEASLFYHLGEEKTVGANSRLQLPDGNITWLNIKPAADAGAKPTGPFDPQLPVLDFRGPDGKSRALLFNHSTHTIGTRSGKDIRSPSFYGLAAQDLEAQLGGRITFLEGASGSTHVIDGMPVFLAIERIKQAVLDAKGKAVHRPVTRLVSLKRPFTYRVRTFEDKAEDEKIARYMNAHVPQMSARVREVFASMRRELQPQQGKERTTVLHVMLIGDVAIAGVPAEYFTGLGVEIKKRSPVKDTFIAELANDWIGYLPDREAHKLGGYQTWTGLHSCAEPGTGERVADEIVSMLREASGN
jgi:neutral ceramidase